MEKEEDFLFLQVLCIFFFAILFSFKICDYSREENKIYFRMYIYIYICSKSSGHAAKKKSCKINELAFYSIVIPTP